MSEPEASSSAWIAKSEHDLLNINNNLNAEQIPWDTVCFHAHQAAEKLLKAFLVYHDKQPMRTHDLVALLARCAAIDSSLAGTLEADCRMLTSFSMGSRYPDDLYEPSEQDARMMVAALHRVRAELLPRLGHPI